jgi:hypothetical protein
MSGCGPQFRHRTPEGAQGLTTENCTRAAIEGRLKSLKSIVTEGAGELTT